MNLKTFISHPVLSSVISILIIVVGIIALLGLPIEQYPDIAPPCVEVTTSYTGASASTIQKAVIAPLEEAINGVEGMDYMVSTASNTGDVSIMVFFKQGTDADMASVRVQNRVSKATPMLPEDVKKYGVSTEKSMNSMLQIAAIYSTDDKYDQDFLGNYLNINIKPLILRVQGIGKFTTFGADYAMRVWMKPDKMAAYGISPTDITEALATQNIEAATGTFGEHTSEAQQYTMVYRGKLQSEEEFGDVIIRTNDNGEVLRLRDVADVSLGVQHYLFDTRLNGHPAACFIAYQTAGSNATLINNQIAEILKEQQKVMPSGLEVCTLMNTNDFLYASIGSVIETLIEAIILVILIVLLFLHDFRSTLIPLVGIGVSLVGTFAFMMVAGFSINLISLFALVLVIGTVVDDSIVVVEAVHEKLDEGYKSSLRAATDAMGEITTAVITSSLVFMAVFIPVSMMGGTKGVFFRQFGLTMAVAVGISAINALTLSPALCALLIKPKENNKSKKGIYQRFSDGFDAAFVTMSEKYKNGIKPLIRHKWISIALVAGSIVLMAWCMMNTPAGFVPQEDKGQIMTDIIFPPSTSLAQNSATVGQIAAEIQAMDNVESVCALPGFSFSGGQSSTGAAVIIRLKPWEERDDNSLELLMAQVYSLNMKYADATIVPFALPMIPGYGTNSDAEVNMQDKTGGDLQTFSDYTDKFIQELNKAPEISGAFSTFRLDNPQWLVEVNVPKCYQAGITSTAVLNTLANYVGGAYVSDFNLYGKVFKVMIQGTPSSHRDELSLNNMFVPLPTGEMASLGSFISLKRIYGAESLRRFNMLNAIMMNVSPAPGCSSGDVISATKRVAEEVLPNDYTFEFGGMAREESGAGSMGLMFAISGLLIFLILSALYESYIVPFSIILTVPAAVMGAYLFTWLFGLDDNIYLQTGVVMLIGLISKTGILIVEFALAKRQQGMAITDAALEAAKARLRPILMTAGTMVIGLLPLLVSSGVGAHGNLALGIGAVFGMLIGCVGLLFLTPALFVVFQTIQERIKPIEFAKPDEVADTDETKTIEQ